MWNPKIIDNFLVLIPPVSLRYEIKTTDFGMDVIEILCLSGILVEQTSKNGVKFGYYRPTMNNSKYYCLLMDCHSIVSNIL